MDQTLPQRMNAAFNRLCKWRTVFCGWQLGTRGQEDAEAQAVRDHREVTMIMRAELNGLFVLLLKKGVFTQEEHAEQMIEEAERLSKSYEKKFPGFKANDVGISVDIAIAQDTTRGWRP